MGFDWASTGAADANLSRVRLSSISTVCAAACLRTRALALRANFISRAAIRIIPRKTVPKRLCSANYP